jgi:hypothetical protein
VIKNSVRQKEKLRRMREEAKWLLTLIGEDWGIRVLPAGADELRPVHANVNKRFETVIGSRQRGRQVASGKGMFDELLNVPWEEAVHEEAPERRTWLQRLSQRRVMRHFEGAPREFRIGGETVIKPETYYFTGRRTRKGETCLTLLMLDVDAHKVGDLKNAMEFARRLKDGFLPDCYVETSTNGKGAHVFLVVDKTDWADADYNAVLRELDRWLKAVLAETGIELDTVEIKGSCATVSWKDGMPKHVAGLLAKLPREWERFDELRSSPTYAAHQLLALTRDNPIEAVCAPKVQRMRRSGSVPCTGIDPHRLERWIDVAKRLLPTAVRVGKSAGNRLVVTGEDVGIFCALLEFVGKRMNEDGTSPWARTKGLWDCLYERGVVRRSFNAKRFAWIRRMLSGMGLVEVQDPTYVIGERAAKWSPSGKFWELASSLDHKEGEEEQDFTETSPAIDPQECWEKGVPLVPIGVQAKETAERRRMDELVEAIVGPCNWNLAA